MKLLIVVGDNTNNGESVKNMAEFGESNLLLFLLIP
jgi:hypothetical protein